MTTPQSDFMRCLLASSTTTTTTTMLYQKIKLVEVLSLTIDLLINQVLYNMPPPPTYCCVKLNTLY